MLNNFSLQKHIKIRTNNFQILKINKFHLDKKGYVSSNKDHLMAVHYHKVETVLTDEYIATKKQKLHVQRQKYT